MAGWFGDKINCRDDFFGELASAQDQCRALLKRLPHENPLKYVAKKLDEVEQWTANGRTPTLQERKRVFLALVFVREYDMTDDDEILALRSTVSGIDSYVTFWPDDKTAADPDNRDYLFLSDL